MGSYPPPDFNPYAPPKVAFSPPPQPYPAYDPMVGVWRHGNLLVMHKYAPLPERCIKSNQPAHRRLKRNLRWHPPLVYLAILAHLLIYIILAAILTKTATIQIGLSEAWFARRRRVMIVAWCIVLVGAGLFAGGIILASNEERTGVILMLVGLVQCLGGALYGTWSARLVKPTKITDTHVWLKGAHPDYLAEFPIWPYPW